MAVKSAASVIVADHSWPFSPWKVAVSGFYKSLNFVRLGSYQNKPIVLDDTGYLLPCQSKRETDFIYELLVSSSAQKFLSSLSFWDAKRPITTDLLSALSLDNLAVELRRVDGAFTERAETDTATTKFFDHGDQMSHRPTKAIQSPYNQDVTALENFEALG